MAKKRLLIISIDALNAKDYDYIRKLENFKSFFTHGSHVRSVESVYPSLTYSCHASIITGRYPAGHGVFHNEKVQPKHHLVQDWYWHRRDIRGETIFDLAKAAGYSSAAALWPVLADAGNIIDWNVPEIWSDRGGSALKLFLKNATLNTLPYVLRHRHLMNGKRQPELDDFAEAVTLDILRFKQPDIIALHLTELDSIRHRNGMFSDTAYRSLDNIDRRLGRIFTAVDSLYGSGKTDVILLGDHGGNDFDHYILLNTLFKQEGLLTTDKRGRITDWKAYANHAGGSVQVHLRHPSDTALYNKVFRLLKALADRPDSPIKELFTRSETMDLYHLFGTYSFVLEAKDGYIFRNHVMDDVVVETGSIEGAYLSDHGFLPSHPNLKTLLLAKGPSFKEGVSIDSCSLVDIGPTIAHLLDLRFKKCDGRVLEELLQ